MTTRRLIAPDWLRAPATRAAMSALAPATPLFVGGCVRDALLQRGSEDIDIAVTSPPAETMALARKAGLAAHATGVDHGVVTIVAAGQAFEAATLRRDVETDGRRAVVAFTDKIAEDAARRDFTINALYADAAGAVADPTGLGLADLDARRIRFIGDAETRIREDYLRILRFFRFHAQLGVDAFDAEGVSVCHGRADGLSRVSRERIGAEMKKLLAAPDPEPALAAMKRVLTIALPGAAPFSGLTAAEARFGLSPDPIRRLAGLGGEDPGAALRLSRVEARRLAAILAATATAPAEAAYRFGADAALSAAALSARNVSSRPDATRSAIERGAAARFPLKAKDLTALGVVEGADIGAALRHAEALWIESGFALGRDDLLARLDMAER